MTCPEEIDYTYVKMPPKKRYIFRIREVYKRDEGKIYDSMDDFIKEVDDQD